MTIIQDNLDNLRAYPLEDAEGSVAHINVEKLRLFALDTADIRRVFLAPTYHSSAPSISRVSGRTYVTVQIP
jgi:hypothetical protein